MLNNFSKRQMTNCFDRYFTNNLFSELYFPSYIKKTRQTTDENYLVSIGYYPGMVKCYDLNNFSIKFQRVLSSCINDFQIVSEDWKQILFLCSNKIEVHSMSGNHFNIKMPEAAYVFKYIKKENVVYIPTLNGNILRYSLIKCKSLKKINNLSDGSKISCSFSSQKNMIAFGTSRGYVEFWDTRVTKNFINIFDVTKFLNSNDKISKIKFDQKNTYNINIGTQKGNLFIYDIRRSIPLVSKKISSKNEVLSITQLNSDIAVSTFNCIKIISPDQANTKYKINFPTKINDLYFFSKYNCILISSNHKRLGVIYL